MCIRRYHDCSYRGSSRNLGCADRRLVTSTAPTSAAAVFVIASSIQSSSSEHTVVKTVLFLSTPFVQLFCHFSSPFISYPNIVFSSSTLELLVLMSSSCRPPSHHIVLCKFYSSPFFTKTNLLEMCMVCLESVTLLTINTEDLISNIMRGNCSETTYVSLFDNPLFIILKCDRDIPVVHAEFYSLSVPD